MLVGQPGSGKSFLTCDLAARVSRGLPWPCGAKGQTGQVVLLSAEDDPSDTIRPRLEAHKVDLSQVHLLKAARQVDVLGQVKERPVSLLDVDVLESALEQVPFCRLLVVDPIGSYLGEQTDAHRDNAVRAVLAPLVRLAEAKRFAVVVVAHRRKSAAKEMDDTALGSRAFTGLARAVWHLGKDPVDPARRLLLPGKNNLAQAQSGFAFWISGEPPRVAWESLSIDMTADEAFAQGRMDREQVSALQKAQAFLEEALDNGAVKVSELKQDAQDLGIAYRTLERAKHALPIQTRRLTLGGPCWWEWGEEQDAEGR